jgi:hypothetical protein
VQMFSIRSQTDKDRGEFHKILKEVAIERGSASPIRLSKQTLKNCAQNNHKPPPSKRKNPDDRPCKRATATGPDTFLGGGAALWIIFLSRRWHGSR